MTLPKDGCLTGVDFDAPILADLASGHLAVFTARSPQKGEREGNEDAVGVFAVDADRGVIAVADGCGGMPRGDEAARLAIESLSEALAGRIEPVQVRTAILDGFERADRRIRDLGVGAGTTLVVAEIDGATLRCYHVGDSGVLAVGNRGRIRAQTVDHSPVSYAVEAGMLEADSALLHEDRNLVSNIVGMGDMRIELGSPVSLRPLDSVVVGSDGLFDNLQVAEITELIRKGPMKRAANAVLTSVRSRMLADDPAVPGKPDDLAFVIYRPR